MTTIGVVTVGRSDYGLYRPILRKIQSEPDLELSLFVSGMHLAPEFGLTPYTEPTAFGATRLAVRHGR